MILDEATSALDEQS
jgi:ABC-type multidrug transport system fused ATPase/permease subunit